MEKFQVGDHVHIRGKDVNGEIIDVSPARSNGEVCYTVEKDERGYTGDPDAYCVAGWELYDCFADQLEKI